MNTNCENKFDNETIDMTISDLIPLTLKRWRKILLTGIIIAVALGMVKFIPLYNAATVTDNEDANKLVQKSVEQIQSQINLKENELKESIYYNLEPSIVTSGFISFYIDTPSQDVGLGDQKNLVNSYVTYFDSGEIYNTIANQLSDYIKPEYLAQIVQAKADYENGLNSFNVYVMGSNKEQVNNIMQLLKQEVYNKKTEVSSIVSEHSIRLVSENVTVITDPQITIDKQFQTDSINNLKTKLEEKKSELKTIVTKKHALVTGLIFSLIGLLCGIALSATYYFVVIAFSNKVKSRNQMINHYGLDVLGEFNQEHKSNNKLDVIISKLAGEPYDISRGEMNLIIATNIMAMSKSKKILIVGSKCISNIEKIFDDIATCHVLKDYNIRMNDKPINNAETLANVLNYDSVIVIVKKNKTSLGELKNFIYKIEKYKKDFVGVILT